MRVLMMVWNFWPGPEGGAERQCRRQAQALVRRGVACTVLTHRTTFGTPRREIDAGVDVRRFGLIGPFVHALLVRRRTLRPRKAAQAAPEAAPGDAPQAASFAWSMFRWLRRLDYLLFIVAGSLYYRRHRARFDVIHVHGACWMPGWARWLTAGRAVPIVSKETITPVLKPFDADVPFRSVWEARRRNALFLAIHPQMADELRAAGIPPERIRVIPNGVQLPAEASDVSHNRDVLFIGNFTQGVHHKAFDVLFEMWRRVASRDAMATLHVLGGGDASPWRQRVARDGLADRVAFHGFVPDPSAFYRSAALFVLPSRLEGVSNALLEAQSWGVPAVVSDIPGNRAVVEDGVTGFVRPVNDAGAMAEDVVRLLADPDLRARLGDAARERIRERFGIDAVAADLSRLYKELRAGAPYPHAG